MTEYMADFPKATQKLLKLAAAQTAKMRKQMIIVHARKGGRKGAQYGPKQCKKMQRKCEENEKKEAKASEWECM